MRRYARSLPIALLAFLGGACGPIFDVDRNFDYAGASEQEQQRYLEKESKRIAQGVRLGGLGVFEVTQVFADASLDLMSVSAKTKSTNGDRILASQIEDLRRDMHRSMCVEMDNRSDLDEGCTIRLRYGASWAIIEANKNTCARYL